MRESGPTHKDLAFAGLLALAACTTPSSTDQSESPARSLTQPAVRIFDGRSTGAEFLMSHSRHVTLAFTSSDSEFNEYRLPKKLASDGHCLAIDGVPQAIQISRPDFLDKLATSQNYYDQFGNYITINAPKLQLLEPLSAITVSFPLLVASGGEYKARDFDLTPVGGPIVKGLIFGKTLVPYSDGITLSDVPEEELSDRFSAVLAELRAGPRDVESVCGLPGGTLVKNIAVLDSDLIFAGCNEANPEMFLITTACLDKFLHDPFAARIVARHETLHLFDRYLGYPSAGQEFKRFYDEERSNHKKELEAFNEAAVYKALPSGGHATDNSRELWASFLNYILMKQDGVDVPVLPLTEACAAATLAAMLKSSRASDSCPLYEMLKTDW